MRAIDEDSGDELEYVVTGSHANGWQVESQDGKVVTDEMGSEYHGSIASVERQVEEDAKGFLSSAQGDGGPTRYGPDTYPDLTLPGPGQDTHRELLLQLPVPPGTRPLTQVRQEMDDANQALIRFMGGRPTSEFLPTIINDPEQLKQYAQLQMAAQALRDEYTDITQGPTRQVYDRGHWSEPNVVLHVRFTERTDAQGRRILMIEELPVGLAADRPQGRVHPSPGPAEGLPLRDEDASLARPLVADRHRRRLDPETGEYVNPRRIEPGTPEHDAYVKEHSDLYVVSQRGTEGPFLDEAEALKRIRQRLPKAVPDMPFSRTQSLIALGLRRMIRYAAENGFEQIGWTRGQVHDIRYPDPDRPADAFTKFYDQMVVEIANDLGETWGVKVGSTEIDTGDLGYPYMQHHQGRIAVRDGNDELIEVFDTQEQAAAYIQDNQAGLMAGGERVHTMEIPAQMRRSALEQGMPLFMAAQEPPDLSGAMPLWDERDEVEDIDPELPRRHGLPGRCLRDREP